MIFDGSEGAIRPDDAHMLVEGPDGRLYRIDEVPEDMIQKVFMDVAKQSKNEVVDTINLLRSVVSNLLRLTHNALHEHGHEEATETGIENASLLGDAIGEIGAFMHQHHMIPIEVFQAQIEAALAAMRGDISGAEAIDMAKSAWKDLAPEVVAKAERAKRIATGQEPSDADMEPEAPSPDLVQAEAVRDLMKKYFGM